MVQWNPGFCSILPGLVGRGSIRPYSDEKGIDPFLIWEVIVTEGLEVTAVCWSAFHCYNKTPEIISFRRGEVHFGSQFWRFQSVVSWFIAFGPVERQHLMEGACGRGN
jgi:hypothetical protein